MTQTSMEASNTPLMLAVKRENGAIVQIILEFGIKPANADTALAEVLLKHVLRSSSTQRIESGNKVTTELLAFAGRMEGGLAVEAEKQADEGEENWNQVPARPVHLADVQRSVQRDLGQQDEGLVRWSERSRMADKEDKEGDPEVQRIGELKTSFEDTSGDL
ncbi:hypothetical protein EDB83DRAFT_2525318 [Lactarius deliciosus]|nr:hypothetical protein EDB83DRAFT_2525318 [Lactarius deliciosus]